MKKITLSLTLLLLVLFNAFSMHTGQKKMLKDPVVITVLMKDKDMSAALQSAQSILLQHKFITATGIQASSFTATRTTGSRADYYVADVTGTSSEGKIKLTITFVRFGTGFLKLQKIADDVKVQLEK